jgi:hypothetical protein
MQRSWCRALLAAAFVLAAGSGVSAATSVSIESAAPGSSAAPGPTVVFVHDLAVPASGATVTVCARAHGMSAPTKLATAFIVGSRNLTGTRNHAFRQIVDAPPSVLDTLARDPHATITLIVTPTGHPEAAKTVGPYAVSFVHRAGPN